MKFGCRALLVVVAFQQWPSHGSWSLSVDTCLVFSVSLSQLSFPSFLPLLPPTLGSADQQAGSAPRGWRLGTWVSVVAHITG